MYKTMNSWLYVFGILIVSACIYFTVTHNSKCYEISRGENWLVGNFLIDKCKGRVWKLSQYQAHKGEPFIWDEMVVYDPSAPVGSGMRMNYETLISEYPLKENEASK